MPEKNIATSIGSISRPEAVTLAPKPYPAELGAWTKPWQEGPEGVHAGTEQQGRGVGGPHGGQSHHPQVDQRGAGAGLRQQPQDEQDGRRGEQTDRLGRVPAPHGRPAQRQQQRRQPGRQQAGTQPTQEAGAARKDMDFCDPLRMVSGITGTVFFDDAQRDRVLSIALDGVRAAR